MQAALASDAHLAYAGTAEALVRSLSVQTHRTLSKNLSCQYENELMQVETTGKDSGLRGAQVTVYEHFDGRRELRWQKRKLIFSVQNKSVRQANVADGKAVNARVDKVVIRHNAGHPPATNHPWRKFKLGKAAHAMTV